VISQPGTTTGSRRRRAILAAALELSSGGDGFPPAAVPRLAERVGMTTSALLHFFGNDRRLFQEITAAYNAEQGERA
jgi:AcrR family transcriptional regulator